MSNAGITQLVAKGQQDVYLTNNPQVSFFRCIYKRHTDFSMTTEKIVIPGTTNSGAISDIRVPRSGDLLTHMYLVGVKTDDTLFDNDDWTNSIEKIELVIGGQVIDTQYSEFSRWLAVDLLAKNLSQSDIGSNSDFFYPIRFSCFEDSSCALPLISLQYHDVVLRITWASAVPSGSELSCHGDFVHLDTAERDFFANNPHKILITQTTRNFPSGTKSMDIACSNPVKFICMRNSIDDDPATGFFAPTNKAKFQINGNDLTDYQLVSPNFTAIPSFYYAPYSTGNKHAFFLQSFCLDTSKLQPTGSLNFSRLDRVTLFSDSEDITDYVYLVGYNILSIESGMGGLLFSD